MTCNYRCLLTILEADPSLTNMLHLRYKGLKLLILKWSMPLNQLLKVGFTNSFAANLRLVIKYLDSGMVFTTDASMHIWAIVKIQAWWRSAAVRLKLNKTNKAFGKFQVIFTDSTRTMDIYLPSIEKLQVQEAEGTKRTEHVENQEGIRASNCYYEKTKISREIGSRSFAHGNVASTNCVQALGEESPGSCDEDPVDLEGSPRAITTNFTTTALPEDESSDKDPEIRPCMAV